jgi:hypothetical protein
MAMLAKSNRMPAEGRTTVSTPNRPVFIVARPSNNKAGQCGVVEVL